MFDLVVSARQRRKKPGPSRLAPLWPALLALFLVPRVARAYVDPGAGTMIWQMLVAGFLGAVFYLRRLIPGRRSKKKAPSPKP